MNKYSLSILLLTAVGIVAKGQLVLSGKLVNSETKAPLEFATVSVKGQPVGTVTNADGSFELKLPQTFQNDSITVSHLGFNSYSVLAKNFNEETIELTPNPVLLAEISIETKALNGNELVKEAFSNIRETFAQDPFLLKGFFRQASLENEKYVLLVEAALDIYDEKYKLQKKFDLKEKVIVKQARSSSNYFDHENQNAFDGSNPLKLLLNWNYTRYENQYVTERNDFEIDSIQSLDGKLVYIISSSYSDERLANKFTIHLDAETGAFLKIKNENKAKGEEFLGVSPLSTDRSKLVGMKRSSQEYSFRCFNEQYYLQRSVSKNTAGIIDKKSGTVERFVSDENTLIITEIQFQNVVIPRGGFMDPQLNIKDQSYQYDESFWEDYTLVQLTPLSNKQVNDLEFEVPLTDQFTRNSKRK